MHPAGGTAGSTIARRLLFILSVCPWLAACTRHAASQALADAAMDARVRHAYHAPLERRSSACQAQFKRRSNAAQAQ
jgi:hypothetical protein